MGKENGEKFLGDVVFVINERCGRPEKCVCQVGVGDVRACFLEVQKIIEAFAIQFSSKINVELQEEFGGQSLGAKVRMWVERRKSIFLKTNGILWRKTMWERLCNISYF